MLIEQAMMTCGKRKSWRLLDRRGSGDMWRRGSHADLWVEERKKTRIAQRVGKTETCEEKGKRRHVGRERKGDLERNGERRANREVSKDL